MKKLLALMATLAFVAALTVPGTTLADQAYHTERLPVHSDDLSTYPLRNGMVVNIHTNGTTDFAVEEYNLNGAKPNTTYELCRVFQESILYIEPPLAALDTGFSLTTDKNGNGQCNIKVLVSQVEPLIYYGQTDLHVSFVFIVGGGIDPADLLGMNWINGTTAYETDFTEIHLDAKR